MSSPFTSYDLGNGTSPLENAVGSSQLPGLPNVNAQPSAPQQAPTPSKPGPIKTALSMYFKNLMDNISGQPTEFEKQQIQLKNALTAKKVLSEADEQKARADYYRSQSGANAIINPSDEMATALGIAPGTAITQKQLGDLLKQRMTNQGRSDVQGLKNEGGLEIQGSKNQGATDVAAIRANAMRDVAIGRNQAITEAARTRAWGTVKAAQLRASASGGTDPEDYMDAVSNGMPVNMIPMRVRGQVIAMASRNGIPVSFQKMGPAAQRANDAVNEMMPAATQLKSSLEKYKDQNGLMDRAKAAWEGAKYSTGFATDDPLYEIANKVGNQLKLLGTQPYTSVGRGQYLMEEAKKHLPRPGVDTPKLMYEKTDTLLNILGQMQDDLAKGQFKAPMGMGGKGKAAPAPKATHRFNPATGQIEAIP